MSPSLHCGAILRVSKCPCATFMTITSAISEYRLFWRLSCFPWKIGWVLTSGNCECDLMWSLAQSTSPVLLEHNSLCSVPWPPFRHLGSALQKSAPSIVLCGHIWGGHKKRNALSGSCKALQFILFRYSFRHLVVALRLQLLQDVVGWNQNVFVICTASTFKNSIGILFTWFLVNSIDYNPQLEIWLGYCLCLLDLLSVSELCPISL